MIEIYSMGKTQFYVIQWGHLMKIAVQDIRLKDSGQIVRLCDDDFYNLFWLLWLQGKWQIRSFWIIDGAILSYILKLCAYVPVTVIYKCNLGWKLYLLGSRKFVFTLAILKGCLHNYIQKIRIILHDGKLALHTSMLMWLSEWTKRHL